MQSEFNYNNYLSGKDMNIFCDSTFKPEHESGDDIHLAPKRMSRFQNICLFFI